MIEYKNAEFYTEFFNNCDGFKVIEDFKTSEDRDEKNLYVGVVEVLNTIHPLIVRVEIPFAFPYNKLVFRTKSLGGYPHLIHTGKIKYGDWFCLNTPFAETPEEQLKQEVARLKEWISRQMREDLPAVINDRDVIWALAFANAYEWENPDEVKEFRSEAMLTFVGDFDSDPEYFKESKGELSCIKTPDNRFYAVKDYSLSNAKVPYIIVEEKPGLFDALSDFVQMKELYEWDDETCKHLLPDFDTPNTWKRTSLGYVEKDWQEDEALKQIEILEQELNKEESYLPAAQITEDDKDGANKIPTKILSSQKPFLLEEIKSLKEFIIKNHGFNGISYLCHDYDDITEEERLINGAQEDYAIEVAPYIFHHFALGIKRDDSILWLILYTYKKNTVVDEIKIDLSFENITLGKLISVPLIRQRAQIITEDMYFGRGSFSDNVKSKTIALVGLGAIGSLIASSLAHAGVSKIGLWDYDIVEPGNICRSAYSLKDLGESKVNAIVRIIKSINPFVKIGDIRAHGQWEEIIPPNYKEYRGASFYADVNYNTQETAIKELEGYDLIIDCTGSNEMLHFLSYAAADKEIISMCITNHSKELLCVSNKDGNPFELRKAYLSRIEQDTKNFYVEGSGCYSPTFFANKCDIAALLNLALRDFNVNMEEGKLMHSTVYSYADRGIVSDRISTYKLEGFDIVLNVSSETLLDAEEMVDSPNGEIGYIFGSYSKNGKQIMITHIVDALNAEDLLTDAYKTSKGIIDYIGDFRFSGENQGTYTDESLNIISSKAEDKEVNTNNPLLAVRNPDGSLTFFLYINNELVKFTRES